MNKHKSISSAREAAYIALLKAAREESFISDTLHSWQEQTQPDSRDFHLAQEIANGSCRMALTLDHIAKTLSEGALNLKRKERLLLHTALYQHYFMERIPLYALTNETVAIAKKHCHTRFVSFLNAILRKASETAASAPQEDTLDALSVRYSLPKTFIAKLIDTNGLENAKQIMKACNTHSLLMARIRRNIDVHPEGTELLNIWNAPFLQINDSKVLPSIVESESFYIQNATPTLLFTALANHKNTPEKILDLCACPGGKLLLAHDTFPNASLFANDLTERKIHTLKENIEKYHLNVTTHCGPGESYPSNQRFDLIIVDAPCSNSGVLNKRPEARWRLTPENTKQLVQTQKALLHHALSLLNDGGEVWYMTCSILKEENESVANDVCDECNAEIRIMKTILPDDSGLDGGFAAAIKAK